MSSDPLLSLCPNARAALAAQGKTSSTNGKPASMGPMGEVPQMPGMEQKEHQIPGQEEEDQAIKSMEKPRQNLQARLREDEVNGSKNTYISPSDMIMSPATQKLSQLKGKHFGKAKPTSLFARTTSKNHVSSLEDGENIQPASEEKGEGVS